MEGLRIVSTAELQRRLDRDSGLHLTERADRSVVHGGADSRLASPARGQNRRTSFRSL